MPLSEPEAGLLAGAAHVAVLALLQMVYGAASAFTLPAANAVVPRTVPAGLLRQANALVRMGSNAASIGAPLSAGSRSRSSVRGGASPRMRPAQSLLQTRGAIWLGAAIIATAVLIIAFVPQVRAVRSASAGPARAPAARSSAT